MDTKMWSNPIDTAWKGRITFDGTSSATRYVYLIKYRLSWFVLILAAFILSIYIALKGWLDFIDNPIYTSLQSEKFPVWRVSFPAVCICSINRISRQEAMNYANELTAKHGQLLNASWAFESIRYFGRLFDYANENSEQMREFQELLDKIDTPGNIGIYDIQWRILTLSPKCKDLLLHCQWEGHDVDCNKIFSFRLTMEGYCCTFNYVRPKNTLSFEDLPNPSRTFLTGSNNGLIVVLNTSTADYYYPTKNTDGFTVSINSPTEYPDESSGNFNRIILSNRTEAFIKLDVTVVRAGPHMEKCPGHQRGCVFRHERHTEYGGHYSFNDCLIKCKIQKFIALCGCIPFNLPTNFPDYSKEMKSYQRCNLADINCLHRYSTTINTIRPKLESYDMEGLEKDIGDSVSCPDCLPPCNQNNYRIQTTYSSVCKNLNQLKGDMKNVTDMQNVSVVRVYFPSVKTNMYTTKIVFTWQEIIGNFGGMLGLFTGFSIIGGIEIVYFATIKLVLNMFCSKKMYGNGKHSINKHAKFFSSKKLEQHIFRQQFAMPQHRLRKICY